jgi:hypothetical protein
MLQQSKKINKFSKSDDDYNHHRQSKHSSKKESLSEKTSFQGSQTSQSKRICAKKIALSVRKSIIHKESKELKDLANHDLIFKYVCDEFKDKKDPSKVKIKKCSIGYEKYASKSPHYQLRIEFYSKMDRSSHSGQWMDGILIWNMQANGYPGNKPDKSFDYTKKEGDWIEFTYNELKKCYDKNTPPISCSIPVNDISNVKLENGNDGVEWGERDCAAQLHLVEDGQNAGLGLSPVPLAAAVATTTTTTTPTIAPGGKTKFQSKPPKITRDEKLINSLKMLVNKHQDPTDNDLLFALSGCNSLSSSLGRLQSVLGDLRFFYKKVIAQSAKFIYNWPDHLNKQKYGLLHSWFTNYLITPPINPLTGGVQRKKALLLYSPERNLGKTTLAKSFVDGDRHPENCIIVKNGMSEGQFRNRSDAKILILDDISFLDQKTMDKETFKAVITSEPVNLRAAYFNHQFPHGLPVVITTNSYTFCQFLMNDPMFQYEIVFFEVKEYLGPAGTQDLGSRKLQGNFKIPPKANFAANIPTTNKGDSEEKQGYGVNYYGATFRNLDVPMSHQDQKKEIEALIKDSRQCVDEFREINKRLDIADDSHSDGMDSMGVPFSSNNKTLREYENKIFHYIEIGERWEKKYLESIEAIERLKNEDLIKKKDCELEKLRSYIKTLEEQNKQISAVSAGLEQKLEKREQERKNDNTIIIEEEHLFNQEIRIKKERMSEIEEELTEEEEEEEELEDYGDVCDEDELNNSVALNKDELYESDFINDRFSE